MIGSDVLELNSVNCDAGIRTNICTGRTTNTGVGIGHVRIIVTF